MIGQKHLQSAAVQKWFKDRFEMPGSRVLPMEGLRAFAVLLVFFVHYQPLFIFLAPSSGWTVHVSQWLGAAGNAGVDLFFVLSGKLIYEMTLRPEVRLLGFLRRRVRRIYPTFAAVLLLYIAAGIFMPQQSKIRFGEPGAATYLALNALLLPGLIPVVPLISVAWSLSYEIAFYITLPILTTLAHMSRRSRSERVTYLSIVLALFLIGSGFYDGSHIRMMMFVVGMLLHETMAIKRVNTCLSKYTEAVCIAAFMAALAFAGLSHLDGGMMSELPGGPGWVVVWRAGLLGGALFGMVLHGLCRRGVLQAALSIRGIRWLGNMSYSYYLIHGIALHALQRVIEVMGIAGKGTSLKYWGFMPVAWIITVASGGTLFVIIERPLSFAGQKTHVSERPVESRRKAAIAGAD